MDELQISGKRYISAKRIARENGYTADYVGQLIRGGKITGQKVGRAWYVDAASFAVFLGEEGDVAVEIREEVVETPVVVAAAVEEVEEQKVEPVVEAKVEETVEVKKEEPVVVSVRETVVEEVKEVIAEPKPERVVIHVSKEEPVKVSGLRYWEEDQPTLPQVHFRKENAPLHVEVMPTEESAEEIFVQAPRTKKGGKFVFAGVILVLFFASAYVASSVTLNLSIERGSAANASYGIGE